MKTEEYKLRTCLISVSDKQGIVEFASELHKLGIELISTGGTAKLLKENNLPVKLVSDLIDFPEILDGRVKTLHPAIYGGLLAQLDNDKHIGQLAEHKLFSIDLVVVNLYPFEKTMQSGATHEEIIENIDIGGPSMLRAASKNYLWTAPVVNSDRYEEIIRLLKENNCTLPEKFRAELAYEAYSYTAYYDSVISNYFKKHFEFEFSKNMGLPLKLTQALRYGENPHQPAMLYGAFNEIYEKLHGKELSYNNIIDIDSAGRLILEYEEPTVAIIKHTNPCGVGTAETILEAYNKAYNTDNESPFGGIIIANRAINSKAAEVIHPLFTEVIIAPEFTSNALEILSKKKDRRLIVVDFSTLKANLNYDYKSVTNGFVCQKYDDILFNRTEIKVVTKREPTKEEMEALLFAWKVAKHVKSNSIVFASSDRTLGIGAGQMSRVDSARIACEKAKIMGLDLKNSVVASDAYFPFPDGVQHAAEAGATAIIQPGGSVRDQLVIDEADKYNIAMIFTGYRHFKH